MATTGADTRREPPRSSVAPAALPRDRAAWPDEARAAHRDLVRQLDAACRERGLASASNDSISEAAVRQVWAAPPAPPLPATTHPVEDLRPLPLELRRWPAPWRYRVADLERSGRTRDAAVRLARAEQSKRLHSRNADSRQAA